ncbi:hypothetical protein B0H16DRAFT_1690434 [Mycena metata]|uniref:Uncharacterized protein n=1 Tax=Mycena metata TaxID=1033252 RepID=A0AAD7J165_9AGAR|nr:hypothetical protein B0H16DRAFT_1690434 [Mycena metata]
MDSKKGQEAREGEGPVARERRRSGARQIQPNAQEYSAHSNAPSRSPERRHRGTRSPVDLTRVSAAVRAWVAMYGEGGDKEGDGSEGGNEVEVEMGWVCEIRREANAAHVRDIEWMSREGKGKCSGHTLQRIPRKLFCSSCPPSFCSTASCTFPVSSSAASASVRRVAVRGKRPTAGVSCGGRRGGGAVKRRAHTRRRRTHAVVHVHVHASPPLPRNTEELQRGTPAYAARAPRTAHRAPRTPHRAPRTAHPAPRTPHPAPRQKPRAIRTPTQKAKAASVHKPPERAETPAATHPPPPAATPTTARRARKIWLRRVRASESKHERGCPSEHFTRPPFREKRWRIDRVDAPHRERERDGEGVAGAGGWDTGRGTAWEVGGSKTRGGGRG